MTLRRSSSARRAAALGLLATLAACVSPNGERPPTRSIAEDAPRERPRASLPVSSRPMGPERSPTRAIMPVTPRLLATAPSGTTARAAGIRAGPAIAALGITDAEARSVLSAFALTCPELLRRTDASGLTRRDDWRPACDAAATWPADQAPAFFGRYFEAATIGDGTTYDTGYYEPEVAGSRDRRPGYDTPIYRRPPDLIDVDLGLFAPDLKGRKVRGQVQGTKLGLYPDRGTIVGGSLAGKGLEIAWARDPIEFFFLQVQGSGLLRLPDGGIMRVGYDTQNGRDYTGIGRLMKERGLFTQGQTGSMQSIIATLKAQPDGGAAIMNENKAFVFFRELSGDGPLGAMGLPVTGRASVAADPAFVPLGAPVFLSVDRYEADGLWIAQDTGGAIKGANRFDTYWGSGAEARRVAGGMSARGYAWLLLPVGTVARLGGGMTSPTPTPLLQTLPLDDAPAPTGG